MAHSYSQIPKEKVDLLTSKIKNFATDYYENLVRENTKISSFGFAADSDLSGFIVQFNTPEGIERIIERRKKFILEFPK